jgi:tripartite-type tricarboxylate transporter receptor subunit TctC
LSVGNETTSGIRIALVVLAAAAVSAPIGRAQAQSWPTKPLRAFIPFAAGSATDLVPRAVFEPLAVELGQPIVVENRGGAGGTIAGNAVVRADPDGHTILAGGTALTIAPWIVPNIPYDIAKDLTGALMIGQSADVLIVPPVRGWKAVQDLVRAAKAKLGSINYSSAGVGTGTHLNAEKFRLSAGFEAVHIPYKGGAEHQGAGDAGNAGEAQTARSRPDAARARRDRQVRCRRGCRQWQTDQGCRHPMKRVDSADFSRRSGRVQRRQTCLTCSPG